MSGSNLWLCVNMHAHVQHPPAASSCSRLLVCTEYPCPLDPKSQVAGLMHLKTGPLGCLEVDTYSCHLAAYMACRRTFSVMSALAAL